MTFGTRLRAARQGIGLSQEQLGTRMGVTKSTVSAWERDEKLPESDRLPLLRSTLRRSLDWLFDDGNPARVGEESAPPYLPEAHGHLIAAFDRLSERRQRALIDLISGE